MPATSEELNETFPLDVRPDADYEVCSAIFRENRAMRWIAGTQAVCLVFTAAAAYHFSSRRPTIFITRVSDIGEAQAIKYTTTEFTPNDAVIRSSLYGWAKARYTLNRETAARDYPHSYYFLSEKLSSLTMEADRTSQNVARVIAGQGMPNELEIQSVQIQNLGTARKSDGTIAEGNAVVDFVKVFPASNAGPAHREHWTASVNFYMNPEQAAERYANDPTFQMVNPLGLTITFFHEDRAA